MDPQTIADQLGHVLILRDLPQEVRENLAAALPVQAIKSGETLFKQGASPDALFIILEGQVDLMDSAEDGTQECIGHRYPGDLVGEIEMVYRQPRLDTALASAELLVVRWERSALADFMKTHKESLADMQFLAHGQLLARKLRFDWLRSGESVTILTRKSPFILYQNLSLPFLLLAGAGFFVLWALLSSLNWPIWLAIILGFAGALLGVWQWVDWTNDYYLVSDWRAVWLEKVVALYDSRREAPLHTILSVAVNTEMTGRMLAFGDVLIRTYTGKLLFKNVARPHTVAAMIEENWRRLRARQDQADRKALITALQDRLGSPEETPQRAADALPPDAEQGVGGQIERRRHWGFRVRFEEGQVITYRKHWAVLLREIGLPSTLVLTSIGLLGARLGGLVTMLSLPAFSLSALVVLALASLWWLYRYIDWANDIYQVTPSQIIDVYKKPLAREEIKVAPIENILGTEVDRKGLFGIVLNYGDVIANVGTTQFLFEGVFDPVAVQQDIVHAQEAFLQQKSEGDRARRQGEMVELFDIYHDKYAAGSQDHESDDHSRDRHPT